LDPVDYRILSALVRDEEAPPEIEDAMQRIGKFFDRGILRLDPDNHPEIVVLTPKGRQALDDHPSFRT
jgi:hypothetical protein